VLEGFLSQYGHSAILSGTAFEDKSGFRDISLITLLSPARLKSRFLRGIGPTFIFQTASKDELIRFLQDERGR